MSTPMIVWGPESALAVARPEPALATLRLIVTGVFLLVVVMRTGLSTRVRVWVVVRLLL